MKLKKNREAAISFAIYYIVSAAVLIYAYFFHRDMLGTAAVICFVFTAIHYLTTYVRYRAIRRLSSELNMILHGGATFSPSNKEGELSVLETEIYKMTVRLREQQHCLKNEKVYLADSLADISHQIRTPLTSINILVAFLDNPDITYERRRELINELYELLSRIDRLITTLLKISKLDAGTVEFRRERLSLRELAERSCKPLQIPMEIRCQHLYISGEGSFTGDIQWTCEAISNIVKNCMEHTPDGGKITIETSENALYSEIIIRDNGSGILPEDLPRIFERFYKGSGSDEKSFGIGLALARMIITDQNGSIKAESPAGGGAKFIIKFYKGVI